MIRSLKNIAHRTVALLACLSYKFPGRKMTVIGVTGTAGKTTTSHIIYHVLKSCHKPVSLITSIEAIINGKYYDTGFHVTTPSAWQLQKYLHEAVTGGSKYVVLEVTSHALDQGRVLGSSIDIAVITNISHEHIDYHRTYEKYRKVKSKILQDARVAILNKDDENYDMLKDRVKDKIISYSVNGNSDITLQSFPLSPKIIGEFNISNCLAAAAVARYLGIEKKCIRSAIDSFKGIKGRMDEIKIPELPFKIIIDFASKPDALTKALEAARTITPKKIIVVFGCAGLRDRLKRPMMGEIAARLADYVVLTAEDPRTEDVRLIIEEIAQGCLQGNIKELRRNEATKTLLNPSGKYFWRIPDRQEAINFAIRKLARKDDLVLLCGKGHEKSMCYGKIEYPWDEYKAVEKAVSLRGL